MNYCARCSKKSKPVFVKLKEGKYCQRCQDEIKAEQNRCWSNQNTVTKSIDWDAIEKNHDDNGKN